VPEYLSGFAFPDMTHFGEIGYLQPSETLTEEIDPHSHT
jgi:hypothetical protein